MAQDPLQSTVTTLLAEWRAGDECARDKLVASIYGELRRMAAAGLRNEGRGHTLQATVLVHELYLRVFASGSLNPNDRKHLFAIAARQIRHILVDYARARKAQKRGSGKEVSLNLEEGAEFAVTPQELLDIESALCKLGEFDERAAHIVELRFFAGLTEAETAEALGVSITTVKRDWDFARAWLYKALEGRTAENR